MATDSCVAGSCVYCGEVLYDSQPLVAASCASYPTVGCPSVCRPHGCSVGELSHVACHVFAHRTDL